MKELSPQQLSNDKINPLPDDTIDLKKYLGLFIKNWYWFVISVLMAFTLAFFNNTHSKRIYNVNATILIESEGRASGYGGLNLGDANMINGFSLFPGQKNLHNQMMILNSSSQIEEAIRGLDFEISYYSNELFGNKEIMDAPFIVKFDKSKSVPLGVIFNVSLNSDNSLTVISHQTEDNIRWYNYPSGEATHISSDIRINETTRYGDPIESSAFSFKLIPREGTGNKNQNTDYAFRFNSYSSLANYYEANLEISVMHREASILMLSIESECPDKEKKFLNKHLDSYLQRSLDRKNSIADNTIAFIDMQLFAITDSLYKTRTALQDFKRSNEIIDLGYQGQQLSARIEELDKSREEIIIKQNYLKYLHEYLSSDKEAGDIIAPSIMGINDPLLNSLVLGLNSFYEQKVAMGGETSNNPYISTINLQIDNTRSTILENISNMMNNNNGIIRDIDNKYSKLLNMADLLPETELKLFEIERVYNLNDFIYSYLLEQKYTAQIARASNSPDNEIIDYAKTGTSYIYPKTRLNYLLAIFIGFLLPGLLTLGIDYINSGKVIFEEDINEITSLPVLGHIPHSKALSDNVMAEKPKSLVSESFRNVRSRLNFMNSDVLSPSILITSSIQEEGKTFVAFNLAMAYALLGKKTVLLEYDLRRPAIFKPLNKNPVKGLSTYLTGSSKLSEIVVESEVENLWIIPAGPIPPNPSELTSNERNIELFGELKKMFDYIIIDSAPIGIVSDTYSLTRFSDNTIILARSNKTFREALRNTLNDLNENGVKGVSILLNDLDIDKVPYSYKRKYGYYYSNKYY